MTTSRTQPPLKVYWQPGCSSCLKTKEFLLANGVEFESINVLEDGKGFKEVDEFDGLRQFGPIDLPTRFPRVIEEPDAHVNRARLTACRSHRGRTKITHWFY